MRVTKKRNPFNRKGWKVRLDNYGHRLCNPQKREPFSIEGTPKLNFLKTKQNKTKKLPQDVAGTPPPTSRPQLGISQNTGLKTVNSHKM